MVNVTKLQRFFYSIQSTLIVTNTFLAASVCYSHRTGVSKRSPPCAHACVWVWVCCVAEMKWSAEDYAEPRGWWPAERSAHLALHLTVLYVAFKPTEQPGNVRKLAAKGTREALSSWLPAFAPEERKHGHLVLWVFHWKWTIFVCQSILF